MTNQFTALTYAAILSLTLSLGACSGGDDDSDDTTPDSFSFEDETDVAIGETIVSESIEVEGINSETTISIEGGEYSINGGDFTDEEGEVENGDFITVAVEASDEINTETEATVTIGGVEDTFTITTEDVALVIQDSFKALSFSWASADGADFYMLLNKPDADSDFEQVGRDILPSSTGFDIEIPIHLTDWFNSEYKLATCTNALCSETDEVPIFEHMIRSIGYIKAPNPEELDAFGVVKVSADGETLVVGAPAEDGGSKNIDGDIGNNSLSGSGAVYVYTKEDDVWTYQAYIKAPNTDASDAFGSALAISSDGNTLVVGAPYEAGGDAGVDGDFNSNTLLDSGAAFVYQRIGSIWTLQNYLKASNPGQNDNFGEAVAISAFGSTIVVGASQEDGTELDPSLDTVGQSGAAYVFALVGDNWEQTAYLKAPNAEADDQFASAVSITANGDLIAVASTQESSSASGIDGDSSLNDAALSGAVYLFSLDSGLWSFDTYVKASNTQAGQLFGSSVEVSADGSTLLVGAVGEASIDIGVNGDETDISNPGSGAAYLFRDLGTSWSQIAYVKSSNGDESDAFGSAVTLNWDGTVVAVAAIGESSAAEGVSGNEEDNSESHAGAVYVYQELDDGYEQVKYVKAPNTDGGDEFGSFLSLDGSGDTLLIGAPNEQSASTLFENIQSSNSENGAGAIYLY